MQVVFEIRRRYGQAKEQTDEEVSYRKKSTTRIPPGYFRDPVDSDPLKNLIRNQISK